MDLSKLSNEELEKMLNGEDKTESSNPVQESVPDLESVARGAVEGVPFGGQVVSGISALLDNSPVSLGERYNKQKARWDEAQAAAKADDPYLFGGAEVVSDIAGFMAVPGGSSLVKLGAWSISKEIGAHPEQSLGKSLQNAAVATAFGKGGEKGLSKVAEVSAPYLSKLADSTTVSWLTDGLTKNQKILNNHLRKWYNPASKLPGDEATSAFLRDMQTKMIDGKPVLGAHATQESILESTSAMRKVAGDALESVLKESGDTAVNNDSLLNLIKGSRNIVSENDVVTNNLYARVDQELMSTFFTSNIKKVMKDGIAEISEEIIPKKLTLKDIHNLKMSWANRSALLAREAAGSSPSAASSMAAKEMLERVTSLSQFLDSAVPDNLVWKAANKDWANAFTLESITYNKGNSAVKEGIIEKIKGFATTTGAGAGYVAHALGVPVEGAVMTGIAVRQILANGEVLNPKLAQKLYNLSEHMIAFPDSKVSLGVLAAARESSEYFHKHIMGASSEVMLAKSPLDRDNVSVKNNSDELLEIAEKVNPQIANQLREQIHNNNEEGIAATMEQLSGLPEAQKFVKPGMGWNGKIRNIEHKAVMEKNINSMDVSLKQKLQLKKDLHINDIIPVIRKEVPYYIDYKSRNKEQEQY